MTKAKFIFPTELNEYVQENLKTNLISFLMKIKFSKCNIMIIPCEDKLIYELIKPTNYNKYHLPNNTEVSWHIALEYWLHENRPYGYLVEYEELE